MFEIIFVGSLAAMSFSAFLIILSSFSSNISDACKGFVVGALMMAFVVIMSFNSVMHERAREAVKIGSN